MSNKIVVITDSSAYIPKEARGDLHIPVIPLWVIAVAIVGGIAVDVLLLYLWGKEYMSRY